MPKTFGRRWPRAAYDGDVPVLKAATIDSEMKDCDLVEEQE